MNDRLEDASGTRPVREAPLSFAQRRLWFVDRLAPGSPTYNMPMAYRLRGPLDPGALAAALGEVVRRQESLCTRFAPRDDEAVQRVEPLPPGPFPLPQTDLTALAPESREGEARRLLAAEALRPFDLEAGPLFRPLLVSLAAGEAVLLLAMHHIVSDAWSIGVLLRDLAALYAAAVNGGPVALAPLPVQYTDFTFWQNERLQGKRLARQLDFWRRHLAAPRATLDLPADRPRPPVQTHRGAAEPFVLTSAAEGALRRFAAAEAASPFMAALAGYLVLLRRQTGQTDLIVGTPWAARTKVELEGLIGFFVNTLPLRVDLSGDPSFRELLGRVREVAMAAFAHGEVPFERLVEELAPERDLSRSPLFQTTFLLHTATVTAVPRLAEVELEPYGLATGTAKFDLVATLTEGEGALGGELSYNADLYDAVSVRRLARRLELAFAAAVAAPDAPLSILATLTAAERHTLLHEWNPAAADYPGERSIHALFLEQAERTPDAVALIEGERAMTYVQLAQRARSLGRRLRAAGVGFEKLVALAVERSAAMVVGMLAILEAGGAYAPIDPAYPEERLAYLLADSRASLLLTRASLLPGFAEIKGLVPVLLIADSDEEAEEESLGDPPSGGKAAAGGDRLAYLIYTSGSSGRPKGVAVPHRGVVRLVRGSDYVRLGPETVTAQLANSSFDATTFEVWGPLLNGGAVAIVPQEVALSPSALAAELRRRRVTTLFLTTALFNQMAREEPAAFVTLEDLLTGGEAADPHWFAEVLRSGPPGRLLNVYGPTENTTFSTWQEMAERTMGAASLPIGRSIANSQVYVLDSELRPVPIGVSGTLYVGGDGLARGYWHRPELTAERFVPSPFAGQGGIPAGARLYGTGDLVRWLPEGTIDFLGRIDQQVKIRGFRIEPGEIEAALLAHPRVDQAAVLALPNTGGGKRLAAYVVVGGEGGDPLEAGDLRAHLRAELPDYMVPSAFVFLEALPLTANGKVDRRVLSTLEAAPQSEREYAPPETAIETVLADIWTVVLGVQRVGKNDDFWELGGHSLLATKVSARIAAALDIEIPLRTLFQAPILADLAHVVAEALFADESLECDRGDVDSEASS